MKWPFYVLLVVVLCITISTAVTTIFLTTAIENMLIEQRRFVHEYALLQVRIASSQREVARLDKEVAKQHRQLTFIAAASRMGWSDAYRYLREVYDAEQ
jgi:hypothetical protein